jgi:hypothetical protein
VKIADDKQKLAATSISHIASPCAQVTLKHPATAENHC